MERIPLDFNKLIELYNSFGLTSTKSEDLTLADIINDLIYNNRTLTSEDLSKLSKVKSLTYDNEELKKLIVSQQIKNQLIQELFKACFQQEHHQDLTPQSKSSSELIKFFQQSLTRHTEYLSKQKDFYDKIDQIISSFNDMKARYNL